MTQIVILILIQSIYMYVYKVFIFIRLFVLCNRIKPFKCIGKERKREREKLMFDQAHLELV